MYSNLTPNGFHKVENHKYPKIFDSKVRNTRFLAVKGGALKNFLAKAIFLVILEQNEKNGSIREQNKSFSKIWTAIANSIQYGQFLVLQTETQAKSIFPSKFYTEINRL